MHIVRFHKIILAWLICKEITGKNLKNVNNKKKPILAENLLRMKQLSHDFHNIDTFKERETVRSRFNT
ncbi:hypothetical protein V6Z12_A02G069300 [Gossypium hirsutum]